MTFQLEYLHREIANIAYVAADVALTADNHHRLHQTFDICDEANIERVNNLLALAAAEVVNSMHNSKCIMHNLNSMHDAQCIILNFDSGSTSQDSTLTTHDSDLTTQDPALTNQKECGAEEVNTPESCPKTEDQQPTTKDQQSTTFLQELIREFLVCRVLHGWLSVTLPESAKMWHDRAETLLDRLRSLSAGSIPPLTRRLSPF